MRTIALASAFLLLGLLVPHATAAPVFFTTSGTLGSDQTDQTLHGVTSSSDGLFSVKGVDGVSREFMSLGQVNVRATDGFDGVGFPRFSNFDIEVDFGKGRPSLEIQGVFGSSNMSDLVSGWAGKIETITSSAPNLNFELPAPFVQMLAHPENGYIAVAADDWSVSKLNVYAAYQPTPVPVPEPASLLLFAGSTAAALGYRRKRVVRSCQARTTTRA